MIKAATIEPGSVVADRIDPNIHQYFLPGMTHDTTSGPHGVVSNGGPSSYYELPPGASELLDLIEFKNMNFNIGNIFKACYRLGEKHGIDVEYDLNKIIFSAQRELERVRKLKNV